MAMSLLDRLAACVEKEEAVALATVIAGPDSVGSRALVTGQGELNGQLGGVPRDTAIDEALASLSSETSGTISTGDYEVFVDVYPPPPKLVIVGAVEVAQRLTRLAKELGYRVIVTDARAAFATAERFPDADEVVKGWPQEVLPRIKFGESTYVVLLSHDPKFDEPTLQHVLPTPVRYVGAIGSRRTQEQRRQRLLASGFDETVLEKLYGPVGLDLGGKTAEEMALAILGEITAVRHGADGGFLRRRLQPALTA